MNIAYLADQPEFADAVAESTYALWGQLLRADGIDETEFARMVRSRAVKDKVPFTLVAIDAGRLAGSVSVKVEEASTKSGVSPWIGGLFVNQAWRGQGLGKSLLMQAEQATAALGVQTMYLSCEAHNVAFYTRLGWQILERVVSHGDDVTVMHKQLSGSC